MSTKWGIMSKEFYIGSVKKPQSDNRLDVDDDRLTLSAGNTIRNILANGDWVLNWDGNKKLLYVYNNSTKITLWSYTIPLNTEIYGLFFNSKTHFTNDEISKTDMQSEIADYLNSVRQRPSQVFLTNYGDLLITENYALWWWVVFWSSTKRYLIKNKYLPEVYPDFDSATFTPPTNYSQFDYSKLIWSSTPVLPVNKYHMFRALVDRGGYNHLLVQSDDLKMIFFNQDRNMSFVIWSLKSILTKLGEKVDKISGITGLQYTAGKLFLTGGGTNERYVFTTDIVCTYMTLNTVGDIYLLDEGENVVWSFFSYIATKVAAKIVADEKKRVADEIQLENKQEANRTPAASMTGVKQPVLSDTRKYTLKINSAKIVCKSANSNITISGWFIKDYTTIVKNTSDMKTKYKSADLFTRLTTNFGDCEGNVPFSNVYIDWDFNGDNKKKIFSKKDTYIDLTFDTKCKGTYGECVDKKQRWEIKTDNFPYKTCSTTPSATSITCTPAPAPAPSSSPSSASSPSSDSSPSSASSLTPTPTPSPSSASSLNYLYLLLILIPIVVVIYFVFIKQSPVAPPMNPYAYPPVY